MAKASPLSGKLVTLIGGNGFLGRHVAQALLERGARVRVAGRNPESAFSLKPLANLGQLQFARCNAKDKRSIEAVMQSSDAAVYLVGTFAGDQEALQAKGAGLAARYAAEQGAQSFVYISAIGADADDEQSGYARTKGLGEKLVLEAFPKASIMRPSIIFGEEDDFTNMFAGMISNLPALPVFGADSPIQPVWVDDVAEAVAVALEDPGKHGGKRFELGGPDVITMEELHEKLAAAQDRKRSFIPVPDALGKIFAAIPFTPMNSDQFLLLKRGSTVGGKLPTIGKLGITPRPLDLFLDKWMQRYRKHGRFTKARVSS
ncbi:complex I NDUFA9 subunit family protein [Paraurantiacibacter namhicola]|uniref:NmrA-like domain-containing protein n=1 Tax=Paraurantiacibacter namhicola TaxID=645517 RepID=A0A1C7D4T8_9SPHN|nr:complex I NDUFA9 subunit family protein [Paraurantiacibacter namhicola]ANU06480.1 hypothetical protein A6F65_00153 [Paraurantiacibacter namhicola]